MIPGISCCVLLIFTFSNKKKNALAFYQRSTDNFFRFNSGIDFFRPRLCGSEVWIYLRLQLCFPRCVEGANVNMYGFVGCDDWAKKEYCVLKDRILLLTEEEVRQSIFSLFVFFPPVLCLSLFLYLPLSSSLSLSLSLCLLLSHSLSPFVFFSLILSLSPSFSISLSYSLFLSLSRPLSLSLCLTLSHSLSLSLSLSSFLSFYLFHSLFVFSLILFLSLSCSLSNILYIFLSFPISLFLTSSFVFSLDASFSVLFFPLSVSFSLFIYIIALVLSLWHRHTLSPSLALSIIQIN